jgi:hypothetical protein
MFCGIAFVLSALISTAQAEPDIITRARPVPGSTFAGFSEFAQTVIGGRIYYRQKRAEWLQLLQTGLNHPDLRQQFPDQAANARFAEHVMRGVDQIMGSGVSIMTPAQTRTALKFLHGAIVDRVTPAVLRGHVDNPSTVAAIGARLKASTNSCIDRSTVASTEGFTCFMNAVDLLDENLGNLIVYYTTLSNMAPPLVPSNQWAHFTNCRNYDYRYCVALPPANPPQNCATNVIPLPAAGATRNSTTCAARAIQNGIMQISTPLIRDRIGSLAPASDRARITSSAIVTLQTCLPSAASETAITGCIDRTVISSGEMITEAQIRSRPEVSTAFPTAAARQQVIRLGVAAFRACATTAQRTGRRTDGIVLDVGPCEGAVTNNIARQVMEETLRQRDPLSAPVGVASLRRCWPGDQASSGRINACLREGLLEFSEASARRQIVARTPASLVTADAGFVDRNARIVATCLGEALPTNIMEAANLDGPINQCVARATLGVARGVARHLVTQSAGTILSPEELEAYLVREVDQRFMECLGESPTDALIQNCEKNLRRETARTLSRNEITKSLGAHMTPDELEALLVQKVDGDFLTCLQDDPTEARLEDCSNELRLAAATFASNRIIPNTIREEIRKLGGAARLGITDAEMERTIQTLVESNDQCLTENRARLATELNGCFRRTIVQASQEIGVLKLRAEVRDLGVITQGIDLTELEAQTRLELETCILAGATPATELSDTIDKVASCGESVAGSLRRAMTTRVLLQAVDPIERIISTYEACLARNRRETACERQLIADVTALLRPLQTLADGGCPPADPNGPISGIFELTAAGIITLIQESRGRFDEARVEVRRLVEQFAQFAGGSGEESRAAFLADTSTDNLIQSAIMGMLRQSIEATEDDLPRSARERLSDETLIRGIFNSEVIRGIKAEAAGLAVGASAGQQIDISVLQQAVARTFLSNEQVRTIIFNGAIRQELRSRSPVLRFLAPLFAGTFGYDFEWARVRKTRAGRQAEDWTVANLILPLAEGTLTDPAQRQAIQAEANRRIQAALRTGR